MIRYRVFWNGRMIYPEDMKNLDVTFLLLQNGQLVTFPVTMHERFDPVDYEGAIPLKSARYKDQTGREMYEGDLITNDYLESVNGTPVIIYDLSTVEKVTDNRGIIERLSDLKRWRIVGNTYENPEMLESKEK